MVVEWLWGCVWTCLLLHLSLCYFLRPRFLSLVVAPPFLTHPLQNVLDTMLALWHIMLLFVQQPGICIDQRSAFFPSGAAVCAQHIRRLPKGEPSVPNDPSSSCQILFAPTFKLQNASSKLWAQDSFLKCLPPIQCSFPRTRTYRRTSSAICS